MSDEVKLGDRFEAIGDWGKAHTIQEGRIYTITSWDQFGHAVLSGLDVPPGYTASIGRDGECRKYNGATFRRLPREDAAPKRKCGFCRAGVYEATHPLAGGARYACSDSRCAGLSIDGVHWAKPADAAKPPALHGQALVDHVEKREPARAVRKGCRPQCTIGAPCRDQGCWNVGAAEMKEAASTSARDNRPNPYGWPLGSATQLEQARDRGPTLDPWGALRSTVGGWNRRVPK